eukprot:TRINITY_DN37326_c0_g1_i1.p1 TRINITY_DN37326_c0_g1~~TRINITY_DN37326_c0_g1_i1.p1  ORF type:complete len:325 (+),score=38.11 TRINITY_DN37326_c0_g1_i1:71-1045(+)
MTLWPFQHVVCHEAHYTRVFVAKRCSAAYLLWVASAIALVVFPLFATFATDNVWVKEGFYRTQPEVTFDHDIFVVAAANSPNDAVGWSTRQELSSLLPRHVRVPTVRSAVEDHNRDGVADVLKLSVELPTGVSANDSGYKKVLLLASYKVLLRGKINEQLGGLVAVDLGSPYLASGLWVQGKMSFKQSLPIFQNDGVRTVYSQNPLAIDARSNWLPQHQPLTVQALLARYSMRNETVHLEQAVPAMWDYSFASSGYFKIQVFMEVPPQLIYYVPRAVEIIKLGWVQFLAFLLPTWLILRCLKDIAFEHQLVETFVVPQLPEKDQ